MKTTDSVTAELCKQTWYWRC